MEEMIYDVYIQRHSGSICCRGIYDSGNLLISQITGRGSTIVKAIGSYTQAKKDVLLCACSKSQFHLITSAAHEIDPGAFIMVTETNEVLGEGFIEK